MGFVGRLVWLPALLLALTGVAGPIMPLHQFVAHIRAATGEIYKYHLLATAHGSSEGVTTNTRTDYSGLQYVTHQCTGNICIGNYFDGNHLYDVNLNDTALPDALANERFLRGLRTVNSGYFFSPQFEENGGTLVDQGTHTRAGKLYRTIGVNALDASPLSVDVDPTTFLVTYVRDWDGRELFENRQFHKVGSLQLPFALYVGDQVYQQYDTREIDDGPFLMPHGVPLHLQGTTTVPMMGNSQTPLLPCSINGTPAHCLLDTGNSGLSISLELAERLRLHSIGASEVRGLGRYATEVVQVGSLDIGNAHWGSANFVVLHDIGRYGYDAVIGADVLANTRALIDYAQRNVTFGQISSLEGDSVPLAFLNFVPVLPVHLGDTLAQLLLDTGDESTINLSYDFYRNHPHIFSATQEHGVSGVGGNSEEFLGEIPRVQVGNYAVESLQIGTTEGLRATAQGHLGGGFLQHFRVLLDYPHSRVILQPRAGDTTVLPSSTP